MHNEIFQKSIGAEDVNQTIAVHQMGRVGSSSITQALKDHGFKNVEHFHVGSISSAKLIHAREIRLLSELLLKMMRTDMSIYTNVPLVIKKIISDYHEDIRRKADINFPDKYAIVTLVREPISRAISSFFQDHLIMEKMSLYKNFKHLRYLKFLKSIIYKAAEKYPHYDEQYDNLTSYLVDRMVTAFKWPEMFMNHEMQLAHNLDLLSLPFQGDYTIYPGSLSMIVLKFESLSWCSEVAFKKFLDIDEFCITHELNNSKNKPIVGRYHSELTNMKFPRAFVDLIYSSEYVRHYYSAEEIKSFKKHWSDECVE